ncbi:MarR family winged helix-turn-helix transcriptional regulator [Pseudonocardia sp. KRD291]|uniref:MarR family winged helix-turn-helix transcriptional regulator n=1 Tax=Pseudonocardia sp. KRD291 TaxID=2792007 RepID=UPI001C4A433E|nr:MarR family transcriptional regulator [Pseudonocardia sp. KRD291]MBW0105545.1 MarR family transcriptional regulator [Pseudonocardia sp. KRD291]
MSNTVAFDNPRDASRDADDVMAFALAVDRLNHALRRAMPPLRWGASGFTTMDALARTGPRRITELADAEHVSQPGMTGLIGRLAAAGLVERSRDPDDGRATLVAVTDAGREYLDSVHDERARLLARRVRELTDDDRAALFGATPALDALSTTEATNDEGDDDE